jgi:hypothetical protein
MPLVVLRMKTKFLSAATKREKRRRGDTETGEEKQTVRADGQKQRRLYR